MILWLGSIIWLDYSNGNFPEMTARPGTRLLLRHFNLSSSHYRRFGCSTSRPYPDPSAVDEWFIPIKLNTPAPRTISASILTDEALVRLHRLSALEPPDQGTPEFQNVKSSLQSMLAMVDSVKHFEPTEDLKINNHDEILDGRIWPTDESLPIDWESLVQNQEKFLRSRKNNIPGSTHLNENIKPGTSHPTEIRASSSNLGFTEQEDALSMATEGVHIVRRRGLGQQPQNENLFYVARQPAPARQKTNPQ
ncbi:hypothetical protein MJO28_012471 [Puccinia striiformis f. sp. tritici]|uniref:Uncharacterized protein n=4 Tax=Puccinia striiformis TaxID=27350 RepID=A0A0L0VQG2_9BASI|nr:hypothetical protein MJO28_012471 [Puccinia striiformis f. sp. tritici]KAI7945560.1 hypothetical protein MJO29_011948 [Puccinia striiformis f. sp. tritici]KNF01501.1 hypothetical protein PSTG_05281 [Puccinia striiformis f. sp. tritici PST-78]POW17743.1 hypothetical protein PSTT_00405 [Puccinia striiformis]